MASTDEHNSAKNNAKINLHSLWSTVTNSKEFYTSADTEGAYRARIYQGI